MKHLGEFELRMERRFGLSTRRIPVEVLVDQESTTVVLDCGCCKELLENKLPGGILIPIASALKSYFESHGMRNVDVSVNGTVMRRTYKGVAVEKMVPEMKSQLENAVTRFTRKRRGPLKARVGRSF